MESSGRALKCVLPDRLIAIPIHLFPAAKLNHRRDIVTKSSKLPTAYIERDGRDGKRLLGVALSSALTDGVDNTFTTTETTPPSPFAIPASS